MMFWLIVAGWLAVCVLAIRWTLPRLDASDKELEHEEALLMDEEWNSKRYPFVPFGLPPILNQSERWQERARKAEGLGFMDEEAPTPPRAA